MDAAVEQDYGLECTYAEGEARDVAQFDAPASMAASRSAPTASAGATLGFLYGNFSEQIEQRLLKNLDDCSAPGARADDDAYNDKDWL